MKLLLVTVVLALVVMSIADENVPHPRGCIYVRGRCYRECEEGTHSYHTNCKPRMPEATCEVPNPEREKFPLCDYTACYCVSPTVRDRASGKCVALEDCPQN